MQHASTNFVWRGTFSVTGGIAEFTIDYGTKRAEIRLENLEIPDDPATPWKPFYQERMKELFEAILDKNTSWQDQFPPPTTDDTA
ncbi:hypothetical protein [Pseudogulbenkiania subflava]|uniref:Uncharacterized protein n=1 Tax=Pseudogulbenkiania subflava DSM 22618 TaxID=1123014 RepID=A0A1Y6BI25_9NEIS|nr:hypothetical protein [Pseudogulbenkiania subflava]SMF03990.1 hypothetical protein SAMN02745746_00915 [Pseudogulbenkiania subflava DSM 22618]